MKTENIIFDLALQFGGDFANINEFCSKVVQLYQFNSFEDVKAFLKHSSANYNFSEETVLSKLICSDMSRFDITSYEYIDEQSFPVFIDNHINKVVDFYTSIGLNITCLDVSTYLCDTFPKPFDKNKGIALAPDEYDEKKFGIKKGIYFLNSNISSYQSRLLLAHEIIHHICSKQQPELLARGLEEGLCELFSYIANSAIFNKNIACNYIKFRRFKFENPNQKFRIYTDYLRLAFCLLKKVGIDGVVDIINSGRQKVKAVETALLHNEDILSICSIHSNLPKNLETELEQMLFAVIENEVVSPMALTIIKTYSGENSISEYAKANKLDVFSCKKAFEEIQKRLYGCVVDDDIIEFSDIEQIRRNGNVKYECYI